jgi:hypothetical protein
LQEALLRLNGAAFQGIRRGQLQALLELGHMRESCADVNSM